MNLREDVDLEINDHLVDLANQVAKDIGININEEDEEDEEEDFLEEHETDKLEHETDKHESVGVATREKTRKK